MNKLFSILVEREQERKGELTILDHVPHCFFWRRGYDQVGVYHDYEASEASRYVLCSVRRAPGKVDPEETLLVSRVGRDKQPEQYAIVPIESFSSEELVTAFVNGAEYAVLYYDFPK